MSDVPLGAFFSGGIDSTSIVEIMRRRISPDIPTCFTVGFSERDLAYDVVPDDLRFARLYAAAPKSTTAKHPRAQARRVAPARSSGTWTSRSQIRRPCPRSASARPQVKTSRSCCREWAATRSFGGYPRYVATKIASHRRLPSPLRTWLGAPLSHCPAPAAAGSRGSGGTPRSSSRAPTSRSRRDYLGLLTYFDDGARSALYSADFAEALAAATPHASLERHLGESRDSHWLDQAMYLDLKTFLPRSTSPTWTR